MGILQAPSVLPGQVGVIGAIKYMVTTDNLATITTAGYLNNLDLAVNPIAASDVLGVTYSYNLQTNSGTFALFTVSLSNGVITLAQQVDPGNVLLPVVSGNVPVFNGTTGQIKDSGAALSNSADAFIVSSPGSLTSGNFPTLGDAKGTITMGLPPSAASQSFVVVSPGGLITNHIAKFSDANGTVADAGFLASNVMLLNAVNTLSGSGSIVYVKANGTEAANAVTANGQAGVITTSSLTTAGGANYAITWTNSSIASTSSILLTLMGGTNTTKNITIQATAGSGTSTLTIYNNTAATALNGTILIGYFIA